MEGLRITWGLKQGLSVAINLIQRELNIALQKMYTSFRK